MSNDGRQSNAHSRRANYSYIEEQNDARTELLNSKVNQLKHLAVQIGEETKFQNKYLKVFLISSITREKRMFSVLGTP